MLSEAPGYKAWRDLQSSFYTKQKIQGVVRYFRVQSNAVPRRSAGKGKFAAVETKRFWGKASMLLLLGAAAGCGNQYRPVVTPVRPTGPASQPTAYAVAITQPTGSTSGIETLLNFSGDSVLAQVTIGNFPLDFTLDGPGATAYTLDGDGSLSDIPISPTVQTKDVQTSTLTTGSVPVNELVGTGSLYVADQANNAVAVLTGTPPGLKQEIPVPEPGLINLVGRPAAVRFYAISQGVGAGVCATPATQTATGFASSLEAATNTFSASIPLGICPVYGLSSADNLRTFILNRGSGTVTVIDSQKNTLDTQTHIDPITGQPVSNGTLTLPAGPVYAELYDTTSQLVTANYDSNSISVIDVSTDTFNNDSPQFGTIHNIPVGTHPSSVTVLQDGSRAYVANSDDGTVSVVNLSSYTVEKVIAVSGHPRTIVSAYNYPIGKVYVSSPDTNNLTILRTDTDTISATLQMQGNVVAVRVTRQNANGTTQANNDSYTPGNGVPCTPGTAVAGQAGQPASECLLESRR